MHSQVQLHRHKVQTFQQYFYFLVLVQKVPPDELDIHKGEYLRVTNWNFESDWVFGYKSGNKNKKGSFPKTYISICNDKKGIFFIIIYLFLTFLL